MLWPLGDALGEEVNAGWAFGVKWKYGARDSFAGFFGRCGSWASREAAGRRASGPADRGPSAGVAADGSRSSEAAVGSLVGLAGRTFRRVAQRYLAGQRRRRNAQRA